MYKNDPIIILLLCRWFGGIWGSESTAARGLHASVSEIRTECPRAEATHRKNATRPHSNPSAKTRTRTRGDEGVEMISSY